MKKILKILNKYKYMIVPGILGMIAYLYIYGYKILNPTYVDWILDHGGDITQHYLGWQLYRNSPWTFPIGINSIALYPYKISVIFTDSIPFLAVIFKIFSNILPSNFQYIGIYGLLCFILQGITSSIVLKKFIKNDYFIMILSLFFIFSPILIDRMYYHTALSSHYLIFLGFILVLYKENISFKKMVLYWGILGLLCASIHIYFLLIIGIILLGYIISEKNLKKSVMSLLSYLLVSFLTVFLLGGFSLKQTVFGWSKIGIFNFNLIGFTNPLNNYSKFLNPIDIPEISGEGFAYLGLGLIICVILALLVYIYKIIKRKKFNIDKRLVIAVIFVAILSIILATCNNVYYGRKLIFEYKIPEIFDKILSMFRSNARIIWLCYYIIIFSSFYILSKLVNRKLLVIIMVILLYLNISEIGDVLKLKQFIYKTDYNYNIKLNNDKWEKLFKEDFSHLIITKDNEDVDYMYDFTLLALSNNKTISRFYIAQNFLERKVEDYLEKLTEKDLDDSLFVIHPYTFMRFKDLNTNYYKLDDFYIATNKKLDYLEPVTSKNLDTNLHNDSNKFGLLFDKKYKIEIIGNDCEIKKEDIEAFEFETIETPDNKIVLEIEEKDEIYIELRNNKQGNIKIYEID